MTDPTLPPPTDESPEARDRAARIAELEARVNRPRGVGVLPPVAALAFVGALAVLWLQKADLEYFNSPRVPLELGAEGDYRFGDAVSNRYAQIHGTPTVRGVYFEDHGKRWVGVGLQDTPLVVVRTIFPSESFEPGVKGSRPDQRPFAVKGRLLSRADAETHFEHVFAQLEAMGEVKPKWLLVAEAHPGSDVTTTVTSALLGGFALVNLWLLLRGLVAFVRGRLGKA